MFKIAICDDETIMCEYLQKKISDILKQWNVLFCITCYTNALELLNTSLSYDLMILDIQMPYLNGIALAKKLRQQSIKCELIFITILKEYILDAFEVEAADYIYKPIDENRLKKALKRVIKRHNSENIIVQTKSCFQSISLQTIYYIEVINRKIYIHKNDGVVEYYGKLQEVEKQLDERFIKCHRSYIINMDYFAKYEYSIITMKNGGTVPVSRLRQKELIKNIMQYMKRRE